MFAEFGVLNYLTYLVGAVFIILVPGPNTFFVLKTGIAHGVKKGYLAAAGVFIGDAVLMFLAFAGVATLIKTTPVLFNVVRYLGAIYLLWLGGKMLYAVLTQRRPVRRQRGAGERDPQALSDPEPDQSESDSVLCVVFRAVYRCQRQNPRRGVLYPGADPRGD